MRKLLVLTRNTFTETLRQPIYGIIIAAALLLIFLTPSLTMYSMGDDNKFLREIGLSTLFLTSLFIAIFSASGAVGEEIENKTILTVVTKPVSRPVFILSKFLGVFSAVLLAHYVCTLAVLMTIRNGVIESSSDTNDMTVMATGAIAIIGSLLLSAFLNYAYDWRFSSTAIVIGSILGTAGMIFLSFIDRNWKFNPAENGINALDIYASLLLVLAAMILTAIAVMLSCRFNVVVTLCACIGIFLLGLISDYAFGRMAGMHIWAKICWFLAPNLQLFWISDAIYESGAVSWKYIAAAGSYAGCYALGVLSLAAAIFQRRQVG